MLLLRMNSACPHVLNNVFYPNLGGGLWEGGGVAASSRNHISKLNKLRSTLFRGGGGGGGGVGERNTLMEKGELMRKLHGL